MASSAVRPSASATGHEAALVSVAVRGAGSRFANAVTQSSIDDPLDTFVIADQRIWDERGTYNFVAPNPRLPDWGGTMHKAGSLPELAALAGIDPAGLADEVARYNAAVAAQQLDRRLRADAVKVSVFRQVRNQGGWNDAAINPDTGIKLENAILARARELRLAQTPQ